MKKLKINQSYYFILAYVLATAVSFAFGFQPGQVIFKSLQSYLLEMVSFIPFIFILIGLFDVWVPKEKIEKLVGEKSGIMGIFLVILLATLQAGPLYAAFPVAYILFKKGASTRNIFIYLGAFSSLKIPMLSFEIGYLGLKFTLIRSLISIPIFILVGFAMEYLLKNSSFEVKEPRKIKEGK